MSVPKHIAIIMDGNRRFAKKLMAKPWKGHEWGKDKFKKVLEWCRELGISELTVYAFSIQNFNRPKEEFDYLMKIFTEGLNELIEKIEKEKNYETKVNFIGRISLFPEKIQDKIKEVMENTKNNSKYILNIALGYGGREEVIDAVKKISEKVEKGVLNIEDINENSFTEELYMKDEPELVIRTGGERRTSNFLIWQSNYSEWIFLEKHWPEFEKEDLISCINDYQNRERRFGK